MDVMSTWLLKMGHSSMHQCATAALILCALSAHLPRLFALDSGAVTKGKYDIWIIDTHAVSDCDADVHNARFQRLNDNCNWVAESEETFLQTLGSQKSVNYVLPGYMSNLSLGIEQAWTYYH